MAYIKKETRLKVWEKYGCKCAYCGKDIAYKEMQVDHITPIRMAEKEIDIDTIDNYNPSCNRCNHYKRGKNLEQFRRYMLTLHVRIQKQYITKVGIDFGIVTITPFDGVFYFEKLRKI